MAVMHLIRNIFTALILLSLSACSYLPFMGEDEKKVELSLREPSELADINASLELKEDWVNSQASEDKTKVRIMPHVSNDMLIFANENGILQALNISDGSSVWKIISEDKLSGGVGGNNSIAVVGTYNGFLKGFSSSDGSEQWSIELGLEVIAVAHSQDNIIVRTNNNQILSINADNGDKLWTVSQKSPALTLYGGGIPIVMDGIVYAGMDNGKVIAIDITTGDIIWESRVSVPSGRSELDRLVDVDGQIAVSDRVVYAASYHGRVVAIDRTNGSTLWARDIASVEGLTHDQNLVYVTDKDDYIWALEKATGATIWKQDQLQYRQLSAPMLLGDNLLLGDFEGYIHVISNQDGSMIGRKKFSSDRILSAGTASATQVHIIQKSGRLAAVSVE